MGRPRKDGKSTVPPIRVGKPRPSASGRAWRVRAYAPTPGALKGRVTFRDPETGRPTRRTPEDGVSLDELFDTIERHFDQRVALATHVADGNGNKTRRTMEALGALYLQKLADLGRDREYIRNRKTLLTKFVYPVIGDVLVADWSTEHSEKVLTYGRKHVGEARVEDIGSTLSGLRGVAQAKRPGGRWLSRDDDPLEGVSYARRSREQGAHRSYVPPRVRPATERVNGAIAKSTQLSVWDWMPDIISVAAFCAPRLSEQLGLRPWDVDFELRLIDINGVWVTEHEADERGARRRRYRRLYTKNGQRRFAPYAGSQHEMLLARCRIALCLPDDASEVVVMETITAERARRAALTSTGDWRDFQCPTREETWLFPDHSGVPPTRELFNDYWHKVRDAVNWPKYIPYKNLRHHAAMWWRSLGFDWDTIATWDGHDKKTLERYYVLPVEDATEQARGVLDDN